MKTLASRSSKLGTICSLILGAAPGAFAADVVLQKVPALTVEQTPAYPQNLARRTVGTTVETIGGDQTAAQAILLGDPAASYPLNAGKTTLLFALPKIENIDTVSFANVGGAQGNVTIAISNAKLPADSPQWHEAAQQSIAAGAVKAKIGPAEAKYVRLTFDVAQPGQINGLGLYATAAVSDFTAPRGEDQSGSFGIISYVRSDIHAKARALYVSSGSDLKQANNIIDDQTATSYDFAAADGSPTTIVDLGKVSTVRRLSAVYSPRAGSMQFYVMQSLPAGAESLPQSAKIADATLSSMKSVGSAIDDGTQGRAAVEFPETSGRYVMVRWTPAAQGENSFSLAEVAAFGAGQGKLLAANTSGASGMSADDLQTSDGKTMMDGKTMIEAKDMPGEGPAESAPQSPGEGPPPSLPQPPPFTFVPVLVPNSP